MIEDNEKLIRLYLPAKKKWLALGEQDFGSALDASPASGLSDIRR